MATTALPSPASGASALDSLTSGDLPNPPGTPRSWLPYIGPIVLLLSAYGLLGLTFTEQVTHTDAMARCVLMSPNAARIWSVGNVEIGLAYLGVFGAMVMYFLRVYRHSRQHLTDLGLALGYLLGSFLLDMACVRFLSPFAAMLTGDALVMTFTLLVSRQLWFQRLLGVFVPIIFLTCGIGHSLEGASYWFRTYPVNVPWTMVTADIGFAVLVNAARFPAFIRGEDIIQELRVEKVRSTELLNEIARRETAEAANLSLIEQLEAQTGQQQRYLRDVLLSVTEKRLHLCLAREELPPATPDLEQGARLFLNAENLRPFRERVRRAAQSVGLNQDEVNDMVSATGEAAMNAIVHAGGGEGSVETDAATRRLRVTITDFGKGISWDDLPRALVDRGYSTAGTLGHGFWIILQTVENVWLYTGPGGTTIVMEQRRQGE